MGLVARGGQAGLGTVSLQHWDMIPSCLHRHLRGGTWQSSRHSGSMFSHPVMLTCVSFGLNCNVVRPGIWLLWCFKHP